MTNLHTLIQKGLEISGLEHEYYDEEIQPGGACGKTHVWVVTIIPWEEYSFGHEKWTHIKTRELVYKEHHDTLLKIISEQQKALGFYANGEHIEDCTLTGDLETPTGEPHNWACDSDGKFNLELGGIAKECLSKVEALANEIQEGK